MITLINGNPQNLSGLIVPNGSITFQLNIDATVIAAPYGFVSANQEVVFQFNDTGQIQPNHPATVAQLYSNLELTPQNDIGLGTYYLVTFYDANGARLNKAPMWWQFIEAAGSTVDISLMTAYATVGGNVIFYPIPFGGGAGSVTSVGFVGDGTVLSATPSTPVTSAGNVVATLLPQNANLFLAGPVAGAQVDPTFRAIQATDLINSVFGASGAAHTVGAVPDPGSVSGSFRFLREDATWGVPAASSNLFNITNYGSRGQSSYYAWPITTATIVASSTSATLANGSQFINGDGIVIWGAGAPNTLSTPGTPTVTPSLPSAPTGTGPVVNAPAGGTTYHYVIVARTKTEALTAASVIGTTTTGAASLGAQSLAIISLSRSAPSPGFGPFSTVTVTTAARSPEVLSPGMQCHIKNTDDATFEGTYIVQAVPNNTTFTYFSNLSPVADPTITTAATGGTVNWFNCNHLTWSPVTGAWQYFIYGRSGGSLTLLGSSMPVGDSGLTDGALSWDDYGSPMMDNFLAPVYVPNTPPVVATNNYLSTTIVSGGGTNNVILANAASTSVSGAVALQDDAPGILAAATAANAAGGTVYIPSGSTGLVIFNVNSFLTIPLGTLVRQSGILWLNETMEWAGANYWYGFLDSGGGAPSFAPFGIIGQIVTNGVRPGIYAIGYQEPFVVRGLSMSSIETNHSLLFLEDEGVNPTYSYMNLVCGGNTPSNDYMGIGFWMRGTNAFTHTFDHMYFAGGPGDINTDETTTPLFGGYGGISRTDMSHIFMLHRCISWLATFGLTLNIFDLYNQGPIEPMLTVSGLGGLQINGLEQDTSNSSIICNLSSQISMLLTDVSGSSREPQICGYAPVQLSIFGVQSSPGVNNNTTYSDFAVLPVPNFTPVNAAVGRLGFIIQAQPIMMLPNQTLFFPIAAPTDLTATVAAGGSVPVGSYYYSVWAIGPDGGWSPTSFVSALVATTTGNQTVNLSWTGVVGATGYFYARAISSNPTDFQRVSSSPVTTNSASDTSATVIDQEVPSTFSGSGTVTISSTQITAPQFVTYGALSGGISYLGTIAPATLTATRTYTLPNNSGQFVVDAIKTVSSAYPLTVADFWVNITGTTTITAPHAVVGHIWTIFNSGSGVVTVVMDSGNINGGGSVTLAPNTGYEVISDGTNGFATPSSAFNLVLYGTTSGSATIGVAATAGTPNRINLPTTTGTSGYVLATDGGSPQQLSWVPQSGSAGSGTVTSFSSGNLSPLFTTGVTNAATTPALAFTLSTQTANFILAGPTSGSAAAPTFRAMVSADLPAGVGVPGGSNTQFQYNNAGAFGGIADLTFNSPHTIVGGASGIFDFSAVSLFKLPVTTTGELIFVASTGGVSGSANLSWNTASNILTGGFALTILGSTSGNASIGAAAIAGTPNRINLPIATGTAGYILSTDGGNPQQLSWIAPTSAGTVTSVSIGNLSPIFTASVANATTTPAISFALSNQSSNVVFAGPASGSAAAPTFRALVAADIPNISGSIITSGIVGLTYGGTGTNLSATGGAGQVLKQLSGGAAITVSQLNFTELAGTISLAQTPLTTLGDMLYANASPALTRLPGSTSSTKNFLVQTGTGVVSAAPSWGTIAAGDVPNLPASKITTGTILLANGGTSANLSTTGGTNQVLQQSSVGGVITVAQLTYSQISGTPPPPASGTLSDGSPITFNGAVNQGAVTVTLNHTTATRALNVTGLVDGAVYTVIFIQDSTGGAQVTLGTGTTWKVGGNGGGSITLNTAANNQDRFVFQNIAGVCYATLQTQFN